MPRRAAVLFSLLAVAPACHRPVKLPPATIIDEGAEPLASSPAVIVEAPVEIVNCQAQDPTHGELLIPEEAEWLIHFNGPALLGSPLWAAFGSEFEQDEFGEVLKAMRECQIEPMNLSGVWIGVEPTHEQFSVVLHSPGIGLPERATCLLSLLDERIGDEDDEDELIALSESSGLTMIQLDDGAAYLPGPDQLVLTVNDWRAATEELAQCRARPAVESRLRQLVNGIDPGSDMTVIGIIPEDLSSMLSAMGTSVEGEVELAFMAQLDAGLDFFMRLTFGTATLASEVHGSTRALIDSLGANADPATLALLNQISLTHVDREVHIRGVLRTSQLQSLVNGSP